MHKHPSARRNEPTEFVYGLRAGIALFDRHPDRIVRVAFHRDTRRFIGTIERWAVAHRIACVEMHDEELARLSGTKQHEGLCLETTPRPWIGPLELADSLVRTKGTAIALERIRNPYNIGAILRSAAFFGFDAAVLGAPAPHPGLHPDAVRVAEGGAEHLEFARTTDLPDTLGRMRARGITVVGAESEATTNAMSFSYPRPIVIVLGHEREGLSDRAKAQCDVLVAIAGVGAIRSLNVSVAASVLLAEVVRDRLRAQPLTASVSAQPPAPVDRSKRSSRQPRNHK